MTVLPRLLLLLFASALFPVTAAAQGELRFADFGECPLESGETIRDCEIGYRTFGVLNRERSNAVLFPSWFTGTTQQLAGLIGPAELIDSSKFFIIAVDAFGNGVSSSPSNSTVQPDRAFPRFTILDMVRAQHRLVTEVFGLERLRGVVGISMGGMQAFEWLVSYPGFAEKVIPIVGSPQLSSFDLLLWETQLRLIEQCQQAGCADPGSLFNLVGYLVLNTPDYRNRQTPRDQVTAFIDRLEEQAQRSFHAENVASQLRAMLAHDVADPFGGSLENAAKAVQGDLLTVIGSHDHAVTPTTARAFTKLVGGKLLELESPCGHTVFACETARIGAAINEFLAGNR